MFNKILGFFQKSNQPSSTEPQPAEPQPAAPQFTEPQEAQPASSPHAPVASSASAPSPAHTTGQKRSSAFSGEHFEALGNVWEAMLGPDEAISKAFDNFCKEFAYPDRPDGSYRADEDGNLTLLLRSPAEGDMAGGVLTTQEAGSEMKICSFYPLVNGYPNPLSIHDTHTWANGLEGAVAAVQSFDGPPIDFFAPYYFLDHRVFETAIAEQKLLLIELGAVAFSMNLAQPRKHTVTEGPLYDTMLEHFLEENPGKTQDDFEAPVVTMEGARILMPTDYTCEWVYRCPVEEVEELTFQNRHFFKITAPLVGTDDAILRAYLYVSEAELNGYEPAVGDDIEGILWMSGSIAHETGKEAE